MATHARLAIAAALAASLCLGAGCGGDEDEGGGGGGGAKAAKKPKPKKDDKAKKGKSEVISYIPTIESVVPEAERATIRRRLRDRDFLVDPTGVENRDPFRSYVMPQLGPEVTTTTTGVQVQPTEQCKKSQLVATTYPLRDLKLLGIVQRGARRYALFRDTKGVGHTVERGSCLGREKASVTEIGEAHVTIEITPEVPPNTPLPTPEKRSIPLYPNELTVENLDETDEPEPPPSGTTAPPPTTTPSPPPPAPI